MSKRIIVIEDCEECPDSTFGFLIKGSVCAGMFYEERRCPKNGTPDWCPLPAVPEKFDIPARLDEAFEDAESMGITEEQWVGYMDGWNDCLEKILREEEE